MAANILIEFSFAPRMGGTLAVPEKAQGMDVTLPVFQFQAEGYVSCSGILTVELPSPKFTGEGYDDCIGTLGLTIPVLRVAIDGLTDVIGQLDVTIPRLQLRLSSGVDETGVLSVTLPMPLFAGTGAEGAKGTLVVTLPSLRLDSTGLLSIEGTLNIDIPMLGISLELAPHLTTQTYLALAVNIKNSGLTEFDNYNFNSMCHFQGKNLGANGTAIYDLDLGDTDDNTIISWNFRLGYLDLEQTKKKKIKQAWVSYVSNGDLLVTVLYPDGTAYEYSLIGYDENDEGVRVKFGKGIRSKYVAIDVKSVDGSNIKLDVIKLHFDEVGPGR
jgi:hypothetical protein